MEILFLINHCFQLFMLFSLDKDATINHMISIDSSTLLLLYMSKLISVFHNEKIEYKI